MGEKTETNKTAFNVRESTGGWGHVCKEKLEMTLKKHPFLLLLRSDRDKESTVVEYHLKMYCVC